MPINLTNHNEYYRNFDTNSKYKHAINYCRLDI